MNEWINEWMTYVDFVMMGNAGYGGSKKQRFRQLVFDEVSIGHFRGDSLIMLKITEFLLDFFKKVLTGGFKRRWEDNIKMDLQEVGCGGKDWIKLAEIGKVGGNLWML